LAWKIRYFSGKSEIFSDGIENSVPGFTTPQTSNQIDAAVHIPSCHLFQVYEVDEGFLVTGSFIHYKNLYSASSREGGTQGSSQVPTQA